MSSITMADAALKRKRVARKHLVNGAQNGVWLLVVTALAFAVMLPFIWMIVTSLKSPTEVFAYPPTWIPKEFQWSNYLEMWNKAPFGRYFMNSAIVAICVTIGQLTSCVLAAFAFARMDFKGKNTMFMIFLSTTMISSQVTLVPTYLVMRTLD